MTSSILSCVKSGSKYRENSLWQSGLHLSRILGRVYWILGRVRDSKLSSLNFIEVFRLQTPIPLDERPVDLWFKCSFWSEVISLCCSQVSTEQEICRLISIPDNIFLLWLGCLVTLFMESSHLAQEIRFWDFHFYLISDEFLKIKFPTPQFFSFSQALSHAKFLSTFPRLQLSSFVDTNHLLDLPRREEILSLLSNCYQLAHSFLLSCTVEVYSRPASERSNSKDIFRPLVEILDRSKSFITHRQSNVSSHFEYPCLFASHLLSGWIGGSLLMPLSQVESLARLCELPLAFSNNLEDFLVEHGARTTHRDEPKPSHILFLLNLPHLVCGISFFSFSTRVFQCWKPLLRILCISRMYSGTSIRSFLLRAWSLSLLDRMVSQSFLSEKVPGHWSSEYRRCNFPLFSCRSFAITSFEISNSHFFQPSTSQSSSSTFYQHLQLNPSSDVVGRRYQMFVKLCLEKIKVFREYILTSDSLWMDPAVMTITSKTAIIATRIDLMLDFISVYSHSISSNTTPLMMTESLQSLLPNAVFASILSSLRILIFLFGYALEDVIGTSTDTESDCLTYCLHMMLSGFSTIDSICEVTSRDTSNNFINSWKSFQKSSLSLILDKGMAMNISISQTIIVDVPVLVSQASQKSLNLSKSMKDEIFRMIGLLEEKTSQLSFARSPLLADSNVLKRCEEFLLRL